MAAAIGESVRGWGVPLVLHRFDALVNVAREARLTLARRDAPVEAIAHPWSGSTPPDGLTAELAATVLDGDDLTGRIALLDGPPTPATTAAVAGRRAVAQIYISPDETLRPVALAPSDTDAAPVPTPVVSIGRAAGEGFRALCAAGATPVRLQASTVWHRRRLVLPVATLSGVEEPRDFILAGAAPPMTPDGTPAVMDAACLLELCRVLAPQQGRLRRGLQLVWWPAGAAPVAGAGWYADSAWEELGRHAAVYVDLRGLGQGRTPQRGVRTAAALRLFAETTLRDAGVARPAWVGSLPEGNAAPFARLGLPALSLAGDGAGGMSEQDGVDSTRLVRDATSQALILARLCTYPLLPFEPVATARAIEARLREIVEATDDASKLAPLPARATACRATIEQLQLAALHIAQGTSTNYEEGLEGANRALRRLNRVLLPLLHRAGDPYTALPGRALHLLPGLDSALALASGGRDGDDEATLHHLREATMRERNRLVDALNAATAIVDEALVALRSLGFG